MKEILSAIRVAEAYCYDAGAANAAKNAKSARDAVAKAFNRIAELEVALTNLMEDTQHSEHDCTDDSCPVRAAKKTLGAKE